MTEFNDPFKFSIAMKLEKHGGQKNSKGTVLKNKT